MRHFVQLTLVASVMTLATGCSILGIEEDPEDKTYQDYTTAKMSAPLDVPPEVGSDNSQDLFVVPDLMPESKGEVFGIDKDVMAPMQILSLGDDVRANKETQTASAFINDSEIKVWDLVSRFVANDRIALTTKNIDDGILVTDWITRYEAAFWGADDPINRYRYRIKLMEAERPNETRLDIEVVAAEYYTDDEGWEPYLDANRAGAEFMNQILGFMYVENIQASRDRVSQSALGGITVSLGSDPDGNPALVTSSGFEQTWNRVPIAMRMVKMQVDDKDRSQGLYFVSQNEEDEGFFESLAFWSSDDDENSLAVEEGNYRIQVLNEAGKTYIIFTDTDDVPLEADVLAQNFALLARAFKARVKDLNASGGNS